MHNLTDYRINSDYDSLGNNGTYTGSVTIPSNASIPGNGRNLYNIDVQVPNGSIQDVMFTSSRTPTFDYTATIQTSLDRTGSSGGNPAATYGIIVNSYTISPGVVRLEAAIPNPYSTPLSGQSGAETITFKLYTFNSPFN